MPITAECEWCGRTTPVLMRCIDRFQLATPWKFKPKGDPFDKSGQGVPIDVACSEACLLQLANANEHGTLPHTKRTTKKGAPLD
jgi:hypothetical protein